ncbi:beta-ketoacyl-[acyl-carrier-protein] synthase family protein [Streptomyces albiaxialis]|uniref:Beta-ketoacyl-[acyl-carrier-protein] synthase family protein n=1 Tax=Streptomyces albiaxialis TaxID=329523 RepID=A0ABP5HUI3_9ACTN
MAGSDGSRARTSPARTRADDVAVTGLGLVSAAGIGAEETWQRVTTTTSPSHVGPHENLRDLPCDFAYTVAGLDIDRWMDVAASRVLAPFARFAVVAAHQAVTDAGLDPEAWEGGRVAVVIGSSHGGITYHDEQQRVLAERGPRRVAPSMASAITVNSAAGAVCRALGATGPGLGISTACASGTDAIGTGLQLLRAGVCDVAVVGGAEAPCSRPLIASGCQMRAMSRRRDEPAAAMRPFDADRDGFVVGEGAGLLVLERGDHARARGAAPRAWLRGYAATNDAHSPVAPSPEGEGLEQALRSALRAADVAPAEVGHVNAHGTSTVLNDTIESAVLHRVCGEGPLVTSTKAMTGHTLGASGGIETALTVLALQHRSVPPTVNLEALDPRIAVEVVAKEARPARLECAVKTSSGFGGHNAALVLTTA